MKLRKQWMALSVATLAITGLAACGEGNISSGNKMRFFYGLLLGDQMGRR